MNQGVIHDDYDEFTPSGEGNYKGNSEFLASLHSLTINYVPVIMLINIVDYRQVLLIIFINYHWLSAKCPVEWGVASFLVIKESIELNNNIPLEKATASW